MAEERKIVITGMGAVTALGHNLTDSFENLCKGKNGIVEIEDYKASNFPVYMAGVVQDYEKIMEKFPLSIKYNSRKLAYTLKSLEEAMESAKIKSFSNFKCGASLGIETSRIPFELAWEIYNRSSDEKFKVDYEKFGKTCVEILDSHHIQNKFPIFIPAIIAENYGISGSIMATSNACASSNYAIGDAFRKIKSGALDMVVTGSGDEMIDEYMITGFSLLRALSFDNENFETASRPFDENRSGFILGEAGAILILEELEHAKNRGAEIFCELSGFGTSSDGEKITACNPQGSGLKIAMESSLISSGMTIDDIQYINAHATSTHLNDVSETRAIMSLFGEKAYDLKINATKSMIGHTVAAAGAVEACVTALSIKNGICHPTRNLKKSDENCPLFYCPEESVKLEINGAISNSCGFSGGNSCLVFKKYKE